MSEHEAAIEERRALFGGTMFIVTCKCKWQAMATTSESATEMMLAHLSDEGELFA